MPPKKPKLTKQVHVREMSAMAKMFCVNVANNGGNQTKAAIDAGYAIPTAHIRGSELMRRPDVKARVAELRAQQSAGVVQQRTANRSWVLSKLVEEAEKAERASERIAALKLVGDACGMFIQRSMVVESPLDGLSADQLAALLRLAEDLQAAAGHELQAKAKPGARQAAERVIEHDPSPDPSRDDEDDEQT